MSAPIVTGLMAFGMSGRIFHAPFLSTHHGFKLKAVVERHEKKATAFYPEILSYPSIDELLDDEEIKLIIVNTPNFTHFDLASQALKAGKHVLIEKPAAANTEEVKALYDLGREMNRHVMIYQNRRWESYLLSFKKIIERGRLGNLIEVHFRYDRYKPILSPKAFKETKGVAASGLVYDLGPHVIDQAISLFGNPISFYKTTAVHRQNSEVVDYFNYHLTYPNQLNVYLTSGLLIADPLPSFVVHGSLGTYIKKRCDPQEEQLDKGIMPTDAAYGTELEGYDGQLVTMGIDNEKITERIPSIKGDYTHIFDAAYHTIRHQALFPITEEHIAWQMELLEA
jgi:scyllo-inositol 2-dehydrogenase (NADP+)